MTTVLNSPRVLRASMLFLALLCTTEGAHAGVRDEFRQALQRAERGDSSTLGDSVALRGYVLYPDLEAARLAARLRTASRLSASADDGTDRAIAGFLQSAPDIPAVAELRQGWLASLAERKLWADFLNNGGAQASDPALRCATFQARIDSGSTDAAFAAELRDFWQAAPQMPQSCVPVFDWIKAQGLLTPDVIELRTRKALEARNTELGNWLIRMLPPERTPALKQWSALIANPLDTLEAIVRDPAAGFEWTTLQPAFERGATRDPSRAQAIFDRLAPRLGASQRDELRRALALGYALDRRVEALDLFAQLPEAVLDDRAHEWRVRAALWNRRYEQALAWLQRMPAAQAADVRWRYWQARCLQLLGRDAQAQFDALTTDNSYYGLLSAHRLQRGYVPRTRAFTADRVMQKQLMQRIGFIRAQELFLLGDRERWANLEWSRATRDLDAFQAQQAAALAADWGWTVQAVGLLARQGVYDYLDISYPDRYLPQIAAAARDAGMPANWIYGLMRQESLFNARAQSPSNAYGLMQLLLPTAREVARRRGAVRPDVDALYLPEVNIALGTTYLREMRDRFGGQFAPATAAYNAGPNAVQRWLPSEPVEGDVWIENIPYNETRGYVQKVMFNFAVRGWRADGKGQDPAALLRPVYRPAS